MDYAISLERCDCTICGIQLDPMSYRDPDDGQAPTNWYPELWKQDNVVLSGPHSCRHHKGPSYETVPDKAVTCDAAEAYSSKALPAMYFRFKPGFVVPQSEDHTLGAADEWYYIAVNVACLRLAETVIGRSPDAHIHSLGQLWHSLERRCTKTGQAQLSSWPGHVDGPFLPSLTSSLLSNLEECGQSPKPNFDFSAKFDAIPREVKDKILGLVLRQPLPLQCTYFIDQPYWKDLLLQVPFPRDLDLAEINASLRGQDGTRQEWNWEKITRQAMTPVDVVDNDIEPPLPGSYRRAGLHVPRGLQNRRRIWQILEEMSPNDVQSVNTQP
ncbi:hypothetical protein B0J15DRAFT_543528 [Fusarium solani]|uniref:Uncharacterized protein n=1 Tax=Fusarium solani TaxID=169388 RepID=A0A9P9L2C6_FUSSL|nr:uncharacterized protein B0J15DRAFT_543528 [Fusarium solani]KAH7272942.1 hypothetical protein B0J15DRAFT_543528 [Fusarium solani]